MLRRFFKNRSEHERGQLAPFFIVLLVLVIIMALVTVNLSKVAFIKTETANSVDAGALAAGSVMANLFNAIGKASEILEQSYRDFFEEVSLLFITALEYLVTAFNTSFYTADEINNAWMNACSDPCGAQRSLWKAWDYSIEVNDNLDSLKTTVEEIKTAVKDFYRQQFDYYLEVRQLAVDSVCQAKKLGLKLAFMNSGIGNKVSDRDDFSKFLNNLRCADTKEYNWLDGQGRSHSVEVKFKINPVERFELKVTQNTYSEEIKLLDEILSLIEDAQDNLLITQSYLDAADSWLGVACILSQFGMNYTFFCLVAQDFLNEASYYNDLAIDDQKQIFPKLIDAWKGLLPKEAAFSSSTNSDAKDQIICWIDDVTHDHLVRVDTTQAHEGRQEPGLWTTRYPKLKSFSVVNFEGKGQIHREKNNSGYNQPILRFNASIIDTDKEK